MSIVITVCRETSGDKSPLQSKAFINMLSFERKRAKVDIHLDQPGLSSENPDKA